MRRFLALFLLVFVSPALAADTAHEDIVIKVNGMVCDFCAQSVFKVFEEHEEVETTEVNLDTGSVTIHLKPGQTITDEAVNEGIHYAGYDLVSVERKLGAIH